MLSPERWSPFSIFLFVFSVGVVHSYGLKISTADPIITWMCRLFHVKHCSQATGQPDSHAHSQYVM